MNRSVALIVCVASLVSVAAGASGCAAPPKPAAAADSASVTPRVYDQSEYTAPEEKEIFVSSPQETQAKKTTTETELAPSLVTQRKAKQLYPLGH